MNDHRWMLELSQYSPIIQHTRFHKHSGRRQQPPSPLTLPQVHLNIRNAFSFPAHANHSSPESVTPLSNALTGGHFSLLFMQRKKNGGGGNKIVTEKATNVQNKTYEKERDNKQIMSFFLVICFAKARPPLLARRSIRFLFSPSMKQGFVG